MPRRSAPHEAQRLTAESLGAGGCAGKVVPQRQATVSVGKRETSYCAWQFGHATSFITAP